MKKGVASILLSAALVLSSMDFTVLAARNHEANVTSEQIFAKDKTSYKTSNKTEVLQKSSNEEMTNKTEIGYVKEKSNEAETQEENRAGNKGEKSNKEVPEEKKAEIVNNEEKSNQEKLNEAETQEKSETENETANAEEKSNEDKSNKSETQEENETENEKSNEEKSNKSETQEKNETANETANAEEKSNEEKSNKSETQEENETQNETINNEEETVSEEETITEEEDTEDEEAASSEEETLQDDKNLIDNHDEVSRVEWLTALTGAFEMSVEKDNYPDNYYSDIDSSSEYYYTIMLATEFGLIDVEAGEAMCPDDPATREYAAHTLNFCMGYVRSEEGSYTFNESDAVSYPEDIQIAVERGWMQLSQGNFLPQQPITVTEMNTMIEDAKDVIASQKINIDHNNNYQFADNVIVLPESTDAHLTNENEITIYNLTESLQKGDKFALIAEGFPSVFCVSEITYSEDAAVIKVENVPMKEAFKSLDVSGSLKGELTSAQAYDESVALSYIVGGTPDNEWEDGIKYTSIEAVGDREISALQATVSYDIPKNVREEFGLGDGIKATISCIISDIDTEFDASLFKKYAYVDVYAMVFFECNVSFDVLEAIGVSPTIDLVRVPILFVGYFSIQLNLSVKGEITLCFVEKIMLGLRYDNNSGFRLSKQFTKESFTIQAQAEIDASLVYKLGVDILSCLQASIYGTFGAKAVVKSRTYDDGNTPERCTHIKSWFYATIGCNASVDFVLYRDSWRKEETIYSEYNSPVRVCFHYEDGESVSACTREAYKGSDWKYYTPADSRYGYNGTSGGVGTNGKPYTIFEYTLDKNNQATITSYKGNVSALSIPETLDGYTVVGIEHSVFLDNKNLRVVVIPDSVTEIGNYAFSGCTNLSSVTLSKGLKEMGSKAFGNCSSLTGIEIPKSLQRSGGDSMTRGTFYGCDNLKNITFEKGTTKIAAYLFMDCEGIEEIEIPDTVTIIEGRAFHNCKNLKDVSIPNTVTEIEGGVFENCIKLTEIAIPDSVTEIGGSAFSGCINLSNVILSKGLKEMGTQAFGNCSSLTGIEIPKSLESSGGDDSVYRGTFYGCDNLKNITFEKGTTKIAAYLFMDCEGIEEIEIPDTVTIIEWDAFNNCKNLKKVSIPNTVTEIEGGVFENCIKLTEIMVPDSVTEIGSSVFSGCSNLSNVTLSKGLEKMGSKAFGNCSSLTGIEIPKSLERSGGDSMTRGTFYGCDNLKNITFEKGITKIAAYLFMDCEGIEEIEIPDTVTIIEWDAFHNCKNLKKVSIPNTVIKIESRAFENCAKLTEIAIPDRVTEIGGSAFTDCTSLLQIIIPDSVISIGAYCFENCTNLSSVTLSKNIKSIKNSLFKNSGVSKIIIPDQVTDIEEYAFQNCISLAEVTLPDSLQKIEAYAFNNCDALTSITIPDSVTQLGTSIFAESELLNSVTLGSGITVIPSYAFNLCPSLQKIILPYRVAKVNSNAFTNCTSLTEITIPKATTTIASGVFSYPARLTIYGISGTYAESYADSIGAKFVNREVNAETVSLDATELKIANGRTKQLFMCVIPTDFTDEVLWRSSNEDIVSVDDMGIIEAKNLGTATIKVTVGNVSASCAITVCQPVTSISLNTNSLSLEALETYALTAFVQPSSAENKSVEWSTSDDKIVSVDENGMVTALGKGSAEIIVTAQEDSSISEKCIVTVINNGYICASAYEMESPHNYLVNSSDFWVYTKEGAQKLRVVFNEQTALEKDFDFLFIYDGDGNEIGKFTGTELAGQTVEVEGDTVKVKLVSDDAGTAWGFKVDSITEIIGESAEECLVSFDAQNGTDVVLAHVKKGSCVEEPVPPTREGYTFIGWYLGSEKYDFAKPVIQDMMLQAKWRAMDTEIDFGDIWEEDIPDDGMIPKNLWMAGISEDAYYYTGAPIKPEIRVYDYYTLLTEKNDYMIAYKNNIKVGKATITVTGKGNYTNKETVNFNILPADIGSSEVYAMEFFVKTSKKAQKPIPELYYMGSRLKNGRDFTVTYSNSSNIYSQVGEYTVSITGKGNYTGTKILKLTAVDKIVKTKPISIAKASVSGFCKTFTYTGKNCTQECTLTVKTAMGEKILIEGMDYTVHYANNRKAGTATVTYYGRNGYAGKLKKTYKILPYNILENQKAKIKYETGMECVYAKSGSKPKPVISFDGKALKEGVDYTLSYKNNKAAAGSKTPYIVIVGKGNFKGKILVPFTITPQNLDKMVLVATDKVYKNSPNIYKTVPKLMDLDGSQLAAGKDFDKNGIVYTYENDVILENGITKKAGEPVENTDIIPAGVEIRISLQSGTSGNYTGTFTGIYRIVKADIKSAKVTIPSQNYTGTEITLDKSQIIVKCAGKTLTPDDYDIIQYTNNIKRGKATVILKGKGNYGGTKSVKFNIKAKGLLWWK